MHSYDKACAVIRSCETTEQLATAIRYCRLRARRLHKFSPTIAAIEFTALMTIVSKRRDELRMREMFRIEIMNHFGPALGNRMLGIVAPV